MENLNSHERALPVRRGVKVTSADSNNTMDKVLGGMESLIEQFTGEDLRDEVIKESRRQVELKLKAEIRRQQKNLWHNCREKR